MPSPYPPHTLPIPSPYPPQSPPSLQAIPWFGGKDWRLLNPWGWTEAIEAEGTVTLNGTVHPCLSPCPIEGVPCVCCVPGVPWIDPLTPPPSCRREQWEWTDPLLCCSQKATSLLGSPHLDMRYIHVTGTNGKGSVCWKLARTLENAGYKVCDILEPFFVPCQLRVAAGGGYPFGS